MADTVLLQVYIPMPGHFWFLRRRGVRTFYTSRSLPDPQHEMVSATEAARMAQVLWQVHGARVLRGPLREAQPEIFASLAAIRRILVRSTPTTRRRLPPVP